MSVKIRDLPFSRMTQWHNDDGTVLIVLARRTKQHVTEYRHLLVRNLDTPEEQVIKEEITEVQ